MLEQATDGRINKTEMFVSLPVWLRQRFTDQKM